MLGCILLLEYRYCLEGQIGQRGLLADFGRKIQFLLRPDRPQRLVRHRTQLLPHPHEGDILELKELAHRTSRDINHEDTSALGSLVLVQLIDRGANTYILVDPIL